MTESSARNEHIARMATRFADYLNAQVDADLPTPGSIDTSAGVDLFGKLDAALEQLMDLTSVYGSDPRLDLDPLILPASALIGEYLRHTIDARWADLEEGDDGETLTLQLASGQKLDVTVATRGTILTGKPNTRAMAAALEVEPAEEG